MPVVEWCVIRTLPSEELKGWERQIAARFCRISGILHGMKATTITIRLDKDLDDLLTKASRASGQSRAEIAKEALRRCLRGHELGAPRRKATSRAKAPDYLTAEDVADEV